MSKIIAGVFVLLGLSLGGFFVYQQTTSDNDCASCNTVRKNSNFDPAAVGCTKGCCVNKEDAVSTSSGSCCSGSSCCGESTPVAKTGCCDGKAGCCDSTTVSTKKAGCCDGGSCCQKPALETSAHADSTPSADTVMVVNPDGSIEYQK